MNITENKVDWNSYRGKTSANYSRFRYNHNNQPKYGFHVDPRLKVPIMDTLLIRTDAASPYETTKGNFCNDDGDVEDNA